MKLIAPIEKDEDIVNKQYVDKAIIDKFKAYLEGENDEKI